MAFSSCTNAPSLNVLFGERSWWIFTSKKGRSIVLLNFINTVDESSSSSNSLSTAPLDMLDETDNPLTASDVPDVPESSQDGPLWIIFERNMIIRLHEELIMTSNKTIDARGANVCIVYGAGITIQFVQNVIIHNIHIHNIYAGSGGLIRDAMNHVGIRTPSDGDGISIFGSSNIWIDHVSMSQCQDGLIDAIMGSTAITISNCHFTNHNEVMLFGASNSFSGDEIMQITVAFNHFGRGLVQRMPRCRWGFVHVINNDYTHWLMYAIGGSSHPTIISQGNRFIAPPNLAAKEVTKRDYASESEWSNWTWRSDGDLMMNGAFFVQSGTEFNKKPFSRLDVIKSRPGTYVKRLTRFSGTLSCKPGLPC
ncbi:pectate lyase-like [Juglans regia]|uniref:Pectate lyase n=2 Tax=Juglans regia TaxID=51240 RepID=A0A2I4EZ27_JUGRE|nr:pectate lyase-like [Juglans regia]